MDEIVEDIGVDNTLKLLTLQDKAVIAAKRIFSPTSNKSVITSIPKTPNVSSLWMVASAFDHRMMDSILQI